MKRWQQNLLIAVMVILFAVMWLGVGHLVGQAAIATGLGIPHEGAARD